METKRSTRSRERLPSFLAQSPLKLLCISLLYFRDMYAPPCVERSVCLLIRAVPNEEKNVTIRDI